MLAFALGLIFFLPFAGWQKLVSFITSATLLSFGSGPLVWAALRKELPDKFGLGVGAALMFGVSVAA